MWFHSRDLTQRIDKQHTLRCASDSFSLLFSDAPSSLLPLLCLLAGTLIVRSPEVDQLNLTGRELGFLPPF